MSVSGSSIFYPLCWRPYNIIYYMFTNCCVYWMPFKLFLFILKNVLRILKLRNTTFVDTFIFETISVHHVVCRGRTFISCSIWYLLRGTYGKLIQLSDIAMLSNWVRILYIVNQCDERGVPIMFFNCLFLLLIGICAPSCFRLPVLGYAKKCLNINMFLVCLGKIYFCNFLHSSGIYFKLSCRKNVIIS